MWKCLALADWNGFTAQSLVDIVKHGLEDENQKVKTITSLTIAALAEAAAPYGIESFDDVLKPLWTQIRILRGKVLPPLPTPLCHPLSGWRVVACIDVN
jgi:hypothetical protein